MEANARFIEQLFQQPFAVVLLVVALVGVVKRWWVPGWLYDDAIGATRDAHQTLREQTEALKETSQMARATYELLKKTVDSRPGTPP